LYFSAHWCGPCKSFTPTFAKEYEKLKSDGKNVEVVFVSSDKD
jgi:nucleoredoxin